MPGLALHAWAKDREIIKDRRVATNGKKSGTVSTCVLYLNKICTIVVAKQNNADVP